MTALDQERIAQFLGWYQERRDLWQVIRVRGIAVRRKSRREWVGVRVHVSLERQQTRRAPVSTSHALAFDTLLDLKRLPALLESLHAGVLPSKLMSWSRPALRISEQPCSVSATDYMASARSWDGEGALCRSELELRRMRAKPEQPFLVYEDRARCDREFLDAGVGTSVAVHRMLRLGTDPHRLFDDDQAVKVVAAIPARISALHQTADRTSLALQIESPVDLLPRLALVVTSPGHGLARPRATKVRSTTVIVPLKMEGPVQVTLMLDGRAIQVEEKEPLPRSRASARYVAQEAFVDAKKFLRDGLLPVGATNNDWFERSVAHLLTVIGFAAMWWGANRSSPSLPIPSNAADALAFSQDDRCVVVLDSTVETFGKDKAQKLVQRAQRVRRELVNTFGATAPAAVPVLAVAVPSEEIPIASREVLSADGGAILDRTCLERLLDLVEAGASDREIRSELPRRLREVFESRVFPLL